MYGISFWEKLLSLNLWTIPNTPLFKTLLGADSWKNKTEQVCWNPLSYSFIRIRALSYPEHSGYERKKKKYAVKTTIQFSTTFDILVLSLPSSLNTLLTLKIANFQSFWHMVVYGMTQQFLLVQSFHCCQKMLFFGLFLMIKQNSA